jgi:hypothetical protein
MPLSLLDLPTETIMMVLDALCMHCLDPGLHSPCGEGDRGISLYIRQAALLALARTSRQLNVLATPHLYHEPVGKTTLLMRTLVERPDLALHVRSIRVEEKFTSPDVFEAMPGGDVVLAAFEAMVRDRKDGVFGQDAVLDEQWEGEWEEEDGGGLADFLISLCPAVTHLEISLGYDGPFFTMVGDRGLIDLRHVRVNFLDTENGWGMDRICRLPDVAPKLASLLCHALVSPPDISPRFKYLTRLALGHSSIEPGALEPIIRTMPRLETFELTAGDACVSFESHLTPREMQDVLVRCAPGLKSLTVHLTEGVTEDRVESPDLWTSLAGLTKLEHLDFDYMSIFPHSDPHTGRIVNGQPVVFPAHVPGRTVFADLLPRSIRTVRFYHGPGTETADALLPCFEHLAFVAAERFPSLRWFDLANAEHLGGNVDGIRSALEGSGVEFREGKEWSGPNTGRGDWQIYQALLAASGRS